ncbi:hypothetical protein EON80_08440 [bacterium]|nr:MAG: hypothetical protein EON80_08440 [bacterium]
MPQEIDFDALSLKAAESNVAIEHFSNLYGNVFLLPVWYFVARGEVPNVGPYIASNAGMAEGKPMIRAFTDSERLTRFVKENQLEDANGNHLAISIPTDDIITYLEGLMASGVYGIWFNSDTQSNGFLVPIERLRPIQEFLTQNQWGKQ